MSDSTHSCGYHCDIPACVKQRRDKLFAERKPISNFDAADSFTTEPFTDDVFAAYQQGIRFAERHHGITEKEASK